MSKDYYKSLGLNKGASPDEIKRAYRHLAQQHHPDKGGDQEKFKEINEAYQVLSDPQKRAQYDKFGTTFEQARAGGGMHGFEGFRDFSSFAEAFNFGRNGDNFGFEDVFQGIFGGGRTQRGQRERAGHDITVDVEISLADAFHGIEKEITLRRAIRCERCGGGGAEPDSKLKQCSICKGRGRVERRTDGGFLNFSYVVICSDCGGTGKKPEKVCSRCGGEGRIKGTQTIKIKIPAGIQDNQAISLSGQGEAGPYGAGVGDLYVAVHVRPDPRFRRQGADLLCELLISFIQAALGDKMEVPTLSGAVKLKIPEGIESGTAIRLEGKGMPHLHRRGFGDMIVKVKVKTPKRLSKKAKELLEELKREVN